VIIRILRERVASSVQQGNKYNGGRAGGGLGLIQSAQKMKPLSFLAVKKKKELHAARPARSATACMHAAAAQWLSSSKRRRAPIAAGTLRQFHQSFVFHLGCV